MRGLAKILSVLVLCTGIMPIPNRAAGSEAEAFEKLKSLVGHWAFAFRAKQGHVRLKAYLVNTSQAFAGLLMGQADVGLMGHRTWHTSLMGFHQAFGYDPLEIRFATGSYDDPAGSTPGLMFIVHKTNPLSGLTIQQIDGIFAYLETQAPKALRPWIIRVQALVDAYCRAPTAAA